MDHSKDKRIINVKMPKFYGGDETLFQVYAKRSLDADFCS